MFSNCVFMALRELRANLLRTGLTMLGIVIGVASVVTVLTVMQGVSNQVLSDVSAMSKNLVVLFPSREPGERRTVAFKLADGAAIEREVQGILHLAPISGDSLMFNANGREHQTEVTGTTADYLAIRNWKLNSGRLFTPAEEKSGANVCVVGDALRKELFGWQNPVGAKLRSGTFHCRVIGVLSVQGTSMITSDVDDVVIMPLTTYHRRLSGNNRVQMFWIAAASANQISGVIDDIKSLMRVRRGVAEGRPDNFKVEDIREQMKSVESIALQLALAVSGVAAISLVVDGIGIMNVMLVSVTERTREIGIRLAVGAFQSDVLLQFLIEAVLLALAGGLLGAALGIAAAAGIAGLIGVSISLTPEVMALAFGVPATIGIAFGFFPALRASKLDPIEALRYE